MNACDSMSDVGINMNNRMVMGPTKWVDEAPVIPLYTYQRSYSYEHSGRTDIAWVRVGRVVKHRSGLKAHVFRRNGENASTKLFYKREVEEAKAWVVEHELVQRVRERLS